MITIIFFAKLRLNVLPDASVPVMVENVASLDAFVVLDRASTNENLKQIIVYQCKRIFILQFEITGTLSLFLKTYQRQGLVHRYTKCPYFQTQFLSLFASFLLCNRRFCPSDKKISTRYLFPCVHLSRAV